MTEERTNFLIVLVRGGNFSTVWELFQDEEMTAPADLSGKSPRILLNFGDDEQMEWTVAGGELTILSPATDGKLQIALSSAEIAVLTFKAANCFFFLDGEDELLCEGVVRVK